MQPLINSGLLIEVDTKPLAGLFAPLKPERLRRAAQRAAKRTRDWLLTQLRRELAAATKVPQLVFKSRFRKGSQGGDDPGGSAILWIGVNPVVASKIGPGVMTAKGVRVGRRTFDHAFLAVMPTTDHQGIFMRRGAGRLPIVKVVLPIDAEAWDLLSKYEAAAGRMFGQRLEHEINFELGLTK
ncbi:hypothetical protein [Desulfobulbus elongatus]|uniref:hypothetical protein n=1 Tax=Desulfobulbus elongatus TaxID=53332 RepID=UPI00054E343D|nr:hypothetical protein [Desulfobulbus elongatus]